MALYSAESVDRRHAGGAGARASSPDRAAGLAYRRVYLAATIAGASLLMQAGFFITSIFYAVLCGLGLMFVCGRVSCGDDNGYMIVGLCGLLIGLAAFVVGQDDIVLFGSSACDVVVANAPRSGASFFHFRNARVLADRVEWVDVMGGTRGQGSHVVYKLKVAPVVDAGWTEGQPIAALAVIGSPNLGHCVSEWRAPLNRGAILNGKGAPERARAARNLARHEHLTIAPNAIFLRWSSDPEGQAAAARRRLWNAYLIAPGLLTAVLPCSVDLFEQRA